MSEQENTEIDVQNEDQIEVEVVELQEKTNYTDDYKLTSTPTNLALLYLITAQTLYLNFLVSLWTKRTTKT